MDKFGQWINGIDKILCEFREAKPFEHVVIDNFWNEEFAKELATEFPNPSDDEKWNLYKNPIEHKYACNDFSGLKSIQLAFEVLNSVDFIQLLRRLTGIPDLDIDPHLHGAGLHAYPRGGKLDMHLDYCIHPITGMERRINIIIYMNRNWLPEFGGELQLGMNGDKRVLSGWNTAVIFHTSDESFHGIPKQIMCVDGDYRKSMTVYYVTPPRPSADFQRKKAQFFPLPGQPVCDKLKRLYEIRKTRLINADDLLEWPDWETQGGGFW